MVSVRTRLGLVGKVAWYKLWLHLAVVKGMRPPGCGAVPPPLLRGIRVAPMHAGADTAAVSWKCLLHRLGPAWTARSVDVRS
jgi:hypothetical protein